MIKQLDLKRFSVFHDADFRFARNLNIIVGENKSGKTHLLKLAYALAHCGYNARNWERQGKDEWRRRIADKLNGVFKPDYLGRLVTRRRGRERCNVGIKFFPPGDKIDFDISFATNSRSEVEISRNAPHERLATRPVFIPSREILSIYPGLGATIQQRELMFDDTFADLAAALALPSEKGPRSHDIAETMEELEEAMGGVVKLKNDRFYLRTKKEWLEIQLEAEGIRRLATIAHLIRNGTLRAKQSVLFWDEPETNLNPRLLSTMVRAILGMAQNGFQVFVATHSLFILRELTILRKNGELNGVDTAYFTLVRKEGDESENISIQRGETEEEIDPIVVLDAEGEQASRYMGTLL